MWVLLWIWAFLLSSGGTAAQEYQQRHDAATDLYYTIERRDHLGGGSVARIPTCAATCQKQYQINTTTECTHHDIFTSDITRCVQQSCPQLQEVLDWQTYYASYVCNIEARDIATRDFVVAWALFGFATICVAGRMLARSRWLSGPGFWWDDYLVIILWVLEIEMAVCLVYIRDSYGGIDAFGVVDASHVQSMLKWVFISVPFYITGTYGAKVVWVLLYIRM